MQERIFRDDLLLLLFDLIKYLSSNYKVQEHLSLNNETLALLYHLHWTGVAHQHVVLWCISECPCLPVNLAVESVLHLQSPSLRYKLVQLGHQSRVLEHLLSNMTKMEHAFAKSRQTQTDAHKRELMDLEVLHRRMLAQVCT